MLDSPEFFNTHAEAYHAMISDLANRLEIDVRHLKEHQGFEDDFAFDDESAWITDNGSDLYVDWQIVEWPEEIALETQK